MIPLASGGGYVAAAYAVFLALILVYVAIMARRVLRVEREVRALSERRREEADR